MKFTNYKLPYSSFAFMVLLLSCGVSSQTFDNSAFTLETTHALSMNEPDTEKLTSQSVSNVTEGNRTANEHCCDRIASNYARYWGTHRKRLSNYLESLRELRCPQFHEECQRKAFAFTEFTKLLYHYFCDYPTFVDKCIATINDIYLKSTSRIGSTSDSLYLTHGSQNTTDAWKVIVYHLSSKNLELGELQTPCVQVALYEKKKEIKEEYHEIIRLNLPGCEIMWCGYEGDTLQERVISLWTCMSVSCRAKMIVVMVICGLLGLIITLVNITVIVVYAKNPPLRHSQGIYKVSLAFADVLVGIFVFPSFIVNLTRIIFTRQEASEYSNFSNFKAINQSCDNTDPAQLRANEQFFKVFPQSYLNTVGFFTILSFSVSIYSLTVAGFDRLSAVYRPLRYRKDIAKKLAKRLSIGIWILCAIFSIISVFIPDLTYSLVVSLLVASIGENSIIVYLVAFVIPLLLMWIVNGVTFYFTRMHSKSRKHLTMDSKRKTQSIENKLARTLSIMVGVFTLSIVPALVITVTSLLIPSLNYRNLAKFSQIDFQVYNGFELAAVIILTCNSLWNFFIYSARNYVFRKAVRKLKKEISEALKVSECCSRILMCARSVTVVGKRRVSNTPTSATTPTTSTEGKKKSSLIPTTVFNFTSRKTNASSASETSNKTTTRIASSTADSEKTSKSNSSPSFSSQSGATSIVSETSSQKIQYTRNQKGKKKKDNTMMATDDSVLNSFAIDANADRLFLSVMENIDEEISEEKRSQQTKV